LTIRRRLINEREAKEIMNTADDVFKISNGLKNDAQPNMTGFLGAVSTVYGELQAELPCNHGDYRIFGNCSIGAFSYMNYGGEITNSTIGRYCSIAQQVIINPGNHASNFLSTHPFVSDPSGIAAGMQSLSEYHDIACTTITVQSDARQNAAIIGHDVWIGARATILGGVEIGHGSIIAAGAVVTKSVEPYSIVGGVPAKRIRFRFDPDIIAELLSIQWWKWDLAGLGNERDYSDVRAFITRMRAALERQSLSIYQPKHASIARGCLV
jgi:acetyltransferase-like isoleucine patch superfamily enzyme